MEGNSAALVLQAGMFGKWEPGLFQQLGACDRSCDPRKGVPSQEGTACCGTRGHGSAGEQLGLVLSESFSSPKDSMSQDLSPSTSLCLRIRHSEGPRARSVCAGVLGTAKRQ